MTSITISDREDLQRFSDQSTGLYFFSNSATPTKSDTLETGSDGAKNLLYELTTISKVINESLGILTISWTIPSEVSFPAYEISGTATGTTLPLISADGAIIRDRIEIQSSGGYQQAVITGISGDTLTVSAYPSGGALARIPISGTKIKTLCCQVAIKKDSDAGISDIFTDSFEKVAGRAVSGTIPITLKRT